MKTLVIHIGDFKTGSTSIQLAIGEAARMGAASSSEFHYCMAGGGGYVGHHALVNELKGAEYLNGTWLKLAKEISQSDHQRFVISSEAFWGLHPEKLKQKLEKLLSDVQIEFVLYLRPHHSRILAAYTQKVKTGQLFGTLDEFVQDAVLTKDYHYSDKVGVWEKKFPQARFVVRPFVRELLYANDVISDFSLHALNLEGSYLDSYKRDEMNVSPSKVILELMSEYTKKLNPKMNWRRAEALEQNLLSGFRNQLALLYPPAKYGALKLSQASVNLITEIYEEDAVRMDSLYFNNSPVFEIGLRAYKGASPSDANLIVEHESNLHDAYSNLISKLADQSNVFK